MATIVEGSLWRRPRPSLETRQPVLGWALHETSGGDAVTRPRGSSGQGQDVTWGGLDAASCTGGDRRGGHDQHRSVQSRESPRRRWHRDEHEQSGKSEHGAGDELNDEFSPAGLADLSSSPPPSLSPAAPVSTPSALDQTTGATGPGECTADQLAVSLGTRQAAGGHSVTPVIFTDTSAQRCSLRAYPASRRSATPASNSRTPIAPRRGCSEDYPTAHPFPPPPSTRARSPPPGSRAPTTPRTAASARNQ